MKKNRWKIKIKECCENAGTYRDYFNPVIETLAAILEQRDEVEKKYKDSGGEPTTKYTNKAGATNISKNPLLILWDDLNKSALAYWRDLGLTPAGLKKISEKAMQPQKKNKLAEALKDLGG